MENKDKINIKNLNKMIKEYRKLGNLLNILIMITIIAIGLYLLNKLHVLSFIITFIKLLIPLFIGIVIAWLLSPFVDKLSKKVPRIASVIIIYILLIGILCLIIALVVPNFIAQIKDLINYAPELIKKIDNITVNILGDNSIKNKVMATFSSLGSNYMDNLPNKLIVGTKNIFSVLANFVLGIMISFYFSFDYHKMKRGFYKIIPNKYRNATKELSDRINNSLRNYVQGVLIVMLLVFITQAIGLSIAGIKAPLIFALFCAITDIIPYFGPWIGAIPVLIVGWTTSPLVGLIVTISIIIVQVLENNFYQPLIMGHALKIHPVVIMLSLVIFGHFFGIVGMIISTPIIATLKIIFVFANERIKFLDKINSYIENTD